MRSLIGFRDDKKMEQTVNIDNLEINYKTWGEGTPVLALHGWGGSLESYEKLGKELSSMGFKLIVPDLPGFGKSEKPSRPWGVAEFAAFARFFAKSQGLRDFYLFGHSFGGGIAIKWTFWDTSNIKGLILCGVAVVRNKKTLKKVLFKYATKAGKKTLSFGFLKGIRKISKKMLYKVAREHNYEEMEGVMKETFQNVVKEDLTDKLPKIKLSTLVVWGKDDTYTPLAEGKLVHDKIKNSKMVVFDDARHGVHLQQPKKLAGAMRDWIRNQK